EQRHGPERPGLLLPEGPRRGEGREGSGALVSQGGRAEPRPGPEPTGLVLFPRPRRGEGRTRGTALVPESRGADRLHGPVRPGALPRERLRRATGRPRGGPLVSQGRRTGERLRERGAAKDPPIPGGNEGPLRRHPQERGKTRSRDGKPFPPGWLA